MAGEYIDPIDSLMVRYLAGTLPAPARVLVESHLELNPEHGRYVRTLEALAGDALCEAAPADLSPTARQRMLDAIYRSASPEGDPVGQPERDRTALFPRPLAAFTGFDADHVPWRRRLPGFSDYGFGEVDGCRSYLFRIRPGRAIPAHTHKGWELSLVLDGSFADASGRYRRGDICVADDSVDHRPIAGGEGSCICFAVVEGSLKFTGAMGQFIRDLIG